MSIGNIFIFLTANVSALQEKVSNAEENIYGRELKSKGWKYYSRNN